MKIFVASPVEVYRDAEAEIRLVATNDNRFETELGVIVVSQERWQQAQKYERDTWLTYNLEAQSDRNAEHTAGFGNYAALPMDLGEVIEIGCGPFTNVVHILEHRTQKSVWLLDPLVEDYEDKHPHCAYKDRLLGKFDVEVILAPTSAEAFGTIPLTEKFDTVIMANVLPHCQDAMAVFATILHIIKRGGYLAFHECARIAPTADLYDVGHPIAPVQSVLDEFLDNFDPVYRNGDYFIGRRK